MNSSTSSPSPSTLEPPRPIIAVLDDEVAVNCLRYFIALAAIGGNAFLMLLIIKYPRLHQSQCTRLIGLLAFCDLLIGCGVFIRGTYAFYASSQQIIHFSCWTCALVNITQGVGLALDHIVVTAIAIDRLWAVSNPIHYRATSKSSRAFRLCVLLCVVAGVFNVLTSLYGISDSISIPICTISLAAGLYVYLSQIIFFQVGIIVFLLVYTLLLLRFMRRTHAGVSPPFNLSEERRRKVQRKVTVAVCTLMLVYGLNWGIPIVITYLSKLMPMDVASSLLSYMTYCIGFTTGINSACSLPIYLLRHDEIRRCARDFQQALLRGKSWTEQPVIIGGGGEGNAPPITINYVSANK